MTHLPPDRTWRPWDYRYPGSVIHLPSRFAVKVSMYSGKDNRYEDFECERQTAYELGEQTSDAGYARLTLRSSGTVLGLEFVKTSWAGMTGRLRVVEAGEMLFRLLLLVEVGFLASDADSPDGSHRVELEPPAGDEPFQIANVVYANWRSQHFSVALAPTPTAANTYAQLDGVRNDLETRGWLYRPEQQSDGTWAVFRFPGDPKTDVTFAVAQHTDRAAARAAAVRALESAAVAVDAAAELAKVGDEPTRAIRDVMAWNTVWDDTNARPYTCLSRAWIRHLGGWGIWLSDVLYNALLCARAGDSYMARENLRAVFAGQQPAGNLACLVAGHEEWVDRTQLPVSAYVTWRVYLLTGDRTLLEESYPTLRRHYAWVAANRDGNRNGLYEYGSTPTGAAHNTHTKQGAMNESGMDNMPIFDDATFNSDANTLEFEEPGHNSLLALELELLGRIARELGHSGDAAELDKAASVLREKIQNELWDPTREIFAARHWSGSFAPQLSPTSFFPLVAGAASPEQAAALIEKHLLNEREFWGSLPLPSTPYNDPVSKENSYWRGRIWPPLNYFTWEGLRRYGKTEIASDLSQRTWQMFRAEWGTSRHCHENFHISDPTKHDSPDSDPFYSWGALIPMMAACETADVSPWDGLTLVGSAELEMPGRRWSSQHKEGRLTVSLNDREVFAISGTTRIAKLEASDHRLAFRLPHRLDQAAVVRLIDTEPEDVRLAQVNDRPAEVTQAADSTTLIACTGEGDLNVEIVLGKRNDA